MNSLLEIGLLHVKADLLCVVGEGKQASISQTLLYISKKKKPLQVKLCRQLFKDTSY